MHLFLSVSSAAFLSQWRKLICFYDSTTNGTVIMCIFVYFSKYICTYRHEQHSQTHAHTDRMWFIRGDVIRGIVFSDSQREFPYSHCHNSDQTQGDRERHEDRHKEHNEKGNVLSHEVTDDRKVSHKPTCHTHIFPVFPIKVWLCVTECL